VLVWSLYETVFDYANKVAQIEKLDGQMASPNFWDVPEKAQETVQQLKSLRSVVEPLRNAIQSCDDLSELVSMLDEPSNNWSSRRCSVVQWMIVERSFRYMHAKVA
jgi:hypothetical protein